MRDGQGSSLAVLQEIRANSAAFSTAYGCFLPPLLMTNKKKRERERAKKKAIASRFSSTAVGFSFCKSSLETTIGEDFQDAPGGMGKTKGK